MLSNLQSNKFPARPIAAPVVSGVVAKNLKAAEIISSDVLGVHYGNFAFTPLESDLDITFTRYAGPTPESNWVIPGKLLVGAFPATTCDEETLDLLCPILACGVTKFVCLQREYVPTAPENLWRGGNAIRPYFQDVLTIVRNRDTIKMRTPGWVEKSPTVCDTIRQQFIIGNHKMVTADRISFEHFPIDDCGIEDDEKVVQLAMKLVSSIANNEVIYLHCWGGHGRTGTVVSIMLHLMYGLGHQESMTRCQLVHDLRHWPVSVSSPQTAVQRAQVVRVISYLASLRTIASSIRVDQEECVKGEASCETTETETSEFSVSFSGDTAEGLSSQDDMGIIDVIGDDIPNEETRFSNPVPVAESSQMSHPAAGMKVNAPSSLITPTATSIHSSSKKEESADLHSSQLQPIKVVKSTGTVTGVGVSSVGAGTSTKSSGVSSNFGVAGFHMPPLHNKVGLVDGNASSPSYKSIAASAMVSQNSGQPAATSVAISSPAQTISKHTEVPVYNARSFRFKRQSRVPATPPDGNNGEKIMPVVQNTVIERVDSDVLGKSPVPPVTNSPGSVMSPKAKVQRQNYSLGDRQAGPSISAVRDYIPTSNSVIGLSDLLSKALGGGVQTNDSKKIDDSSLHGVVM